MKILKEKLVQQKLKELHHDAQNDYKKIGGGIIKSIFRPLQPSDFKDAYLPISQQQGKDLKELIIKNKCQNIVEFGTSFGISTIYLADGARETGGQVISTELIESKALKALSNIQEAGLIEYVEIRIGDAMQTLQKLDKSIDFLFLDGWKNLYLPLFKQLEPMLSERAIIYADNMDMGGTQAYAQYILSKSNQYATQTIHDGKAYLSRSIGPYPTKYV